jgi:hypothetical protein
MVLINLAEKLFIANSIKADRYKSTVFIDTFVTRFGDLSGSIFMGIGKIGIYQQ